jgi:hypothetical protein
MFTALYDRYHIECESEHETLSEAIRFLTYGWETGNLWPTGILKDAELIINQDAILELIHGLSDLLEEKNEI